MALFTTAPDPAAVLAERRRILREVVLRGGLKPRSDPDRVYEQALTDLDRNAFAWEDNSGVLRPHVDADPDDEHDILVAARAILFELEGAAGSLPMDTLIAKAQKLRIPPDTLKAAVRWLREADLCKLNSGVLRDVSGDKGRKNRVHLGDDLFTLRRPMPAPAPAPVAPPLPKPAPAPAPKPVPTPATTPAPAPEKPAAPLPEPDPAYADDVDQFHPSHPDYLPPAPPPAAAVHGGSPDAPTAHTPREPQGTAQPKPEQLPATPAKPAAFEVLLDVQRRVKRVEEFFSPTVVDPSGTDVLIQSAHPDTVNCLRRVCVLLQVYGSQQRYQLTNGRVSSKHKSRLPEAISLGLRLGVLGLSTANGKDLTLGDHTVVMPDAELERRAAEQRVRDVKNKPRTIREVMGV